MKGLILIIWMILTFILTISLVGLLVVLPDKTVYVTGAPTYRPSEWMEIGRRLLDAILDKK